MPAGFINVNIHRDEPASRRGLESLDGLDTTSFSPEDSPGGITFNNDEAAARFYLGRAFDVSPLESLHSFSAPSEPGLAPEMHLEQTREQPLTNTRTLHFQQTRASIPIFGSSAVVELDSERRLVSLDAEVGMVENVSPIAELSPAQALRYIEKFTGAALSPETLQRAPELNFFYREETDTWHLAYYFANVPAAPPDFLDEITGGHYEGHGLAGRFRPEDLEIDYLVDAHNGEILFYYSSNPLLDIPSKCFGLDEDGVRQTFWGRLTPAGAFELYDPLRRIRTFDLGFQDWQSAQLPTDPIQHTAADWAATNKAAVAAHANAQRVYDFYNAVMKRDGIDDKGMELISYINVTDSCSKDPPPVWFNAVWYQNRMWYGQDRDGSGDLRSFARFIDVIAHELTHGVTHYTAELVYMNLSGALSESFSDIFGIIIKNWTLETGYRDITAWDWELGSGLRAGGLPLRDLCDPTRTGHPDHMRNRYTGSRDSGGVHINSNIHNKAAYNLLTATDAAGEIIVPADEVAVLYYLTLTRLNKLADFSKVRQVMIEVARTYYAGDPVERDKKIDAIKDAYDAVGIY